MRHPNPARVGAAVFAVLGMLAFGQGVAQLYPADHARGAAGAEAPSFGARDLRLGDWGPDVKTLNWVLRAQALGAPTHASFVGETDGAVRALQRETQIKADGVVGRDTRKVMAARMPRQRATWYGPGLYGNRTACGKTLTKRTIGVAHRKLPCGTRVAFAYKGRWVRAKVIDRGPFRRGYRWDLTSALAKRLGVISAGTAAVKAGASL